VLHQTVIVMLAYVIVRWDAPLASKYVLLLAGSAAITFALYEVTVRRMKATRFLFGLKLKPRAELA
jgi:hypothetical protein